MVIKKPKTTYSNEEIVLNISQHIFKHIQNLNHLLANLKKAGITIVRAESQFY